jgi:hypothetical protein
MSTENKPNNRELVNKLQQARALLDECIDGLQGQPRRKSARTRTTPLLPKSSQASSKFDFSANVRSFVKDHASGLSGGEKFGLLLAYLAKGDVKAEIKLKDIESTWNRITSLLGDFNRKYSNDAKEHGLVNTKKHGIYVLRPQWRDILTNQ